MRSKSRRRRRSFVWPSISPANAEPTHFLKIILPGTIHAHNMSIPKEFVRRFENELFTSEATIGVPDGLVWKMDLKKKSENEAWFCKGWEEFVQYYSISFGFFLVFKYEGNSKFSVVIFDSSVSEIHYPCKDDNPENQQNSVSDQSGYNTRRSQRHKLEDEEEIIDIEDENNALSHGKSGKKDRSGKEIDNSIKHEKEKERSGQVQRSGSFKMKTRTSSRKQRALEAAQNFEPANPHFTAIIRPANLNRCYLDVPAEFRRANMGIMGAMKLEDCSGGKWEVNYGKHVSSVRIGKGWIGFARANNVKEGDVCVFELIKRKGHVFKVTIFAC